MMKSICVYLRLSAVAFLSLASAFAVDGTVINRTTNTPQADATVTLYKLGQQNGLESLESVHTDAQGRFRINQSAEGGPHLLQSVYDGVTYNHMLPPGSPTSGVTLDVYNASKQPGEAKIAQHFLILQPSSGQLTINEMFIWHNGGKVTYNDPDHGTLKFYLPPEAKGVVKVTAKRPQGMPIEQAAEKTGKPDIYEVAFPVEPGETQFELSYMVPYTSPGTFASRLVEKAPETLLVVPAGITLKGDGVEFNRNEPQTKASIYSVKNATYKIELSGEVQAAASDTGDSGENSGPSIDQVMPKLFGQIDGSAPLLDKLLSVKWVLLLALAILALGFIVLYRAQAPGETVAAAPSPDAVAAPNRDRKGAVSKGAASKDKHERRRR